MELAVGTPPVRKVATLAVRYEDKEVSDALQAWYHVRFGRPVTQWELFSLVLAAALANEGGVFAGALDDLPAREE